MAASIRISHRILESVLKMNAKRLITTAEATVSTIHCFVVNFGLPVSFRVGCTRGTSGVSVDSTGFSSFSSADSLIKC